MSTSAARRLVGPALGVLVFVAALGIWELWAGAADSFLVPTASEVAERAWDVWPTSDFLSEVGQSMKRLRRWLRHRGGDRHRARPPGRGVPRAPGARSTPSSSACERCRRSPSCRRRSSSSASATRSRIAVIAFGLCFPILVNTAEGVRGIPLEVRDTASMLHVGRVERVVRIYLPGGAPVDHGRTAHRGVAGARARHRLGVRRRGERPRLLPHRPAVRRSTTPQLYAGILFLGLLGYVLNRLFLVAERRVLAWHYGAAGE